MEDIRLLQAENTIGGEVLVDNQRKLNAGLCSKGASVFHAAEADRDNAGTPRFDLRLMRAQLRDVLTAENSTPVAQEDDDRWLLRPKLAQADDLAVNVRQFKRSEPAAEGLRHRHIFR